MRAWIYSVFVTLALISASVAAEERAVHAACRELEDVPRALDLLDRDDVTRLIQALIHDPKHGCPYPPGRPMVAHTQTNPKRQFLFQVCGHQPRSAMMPMVVCILCRS